MHLPKRGHCPTVSLQMQPFAVTGIVYICSEEDWGRNAENKTPCRPDINIPDINIRFKPLQWKQVNANT